jgi:large subunit ribosomal protein L31
MKTGIHPTWHQDIQVTCACGNTFTTGSTLQSITVDICSKCHPFFTGEVRFVDRQGRVDRFMQKMQVAQQIQAQKAKTKPKLKPGQTVKAAPAADPKSYQEILREQQSQLRKSAKAAEVEQNSTKVQAA